MNRILGSTTTRIAIAFLVVQITSVGLALLLMHSFAQRTITGDAQQFARELSADISDEFQRGGADAATNAIVERLQTVGQREAVIALRAPDGSIAVGNIDKWPPNIGSDLDWRETTLFRTNGTQPERMGLHTLKLRAGYQLLTGQILDGEDRLRQISETSLLAAFALGLLMAALGAWIFTRFIGRRVDHIAGVAERFADGKLTTRVEIDGTGDAFDRLSHGINAMLERIETLVSELRLVTDSLAHDLRSPVTRLKATVERAITSTRDMASLEALGTVAEEADRLQNMLTTALQISRAEAGMGRDQFKDFQADALIADLVEVYGPLAEDQGFAIDSVVSGPVTINGHRELLGQAVSNLIDNALKYAVGGNRITLHLEQSPSQVRICVADNGPGIPVDERGAALKRFGRLDAARQAGGAGLGLSLVSTVAHLHGGELILSDEAPGLRATLVLPIGNDT